MYLCLGARSRLSVGGALFFRQMVAIGLVIGIVPLSARAALAQAGKDAAKDIETLKAIPSDEEKPSRSNYRLLNMLTGKTTSDDAVIIGPNDKNPDANALIRRALGSIQSGDTKAAIADLKRAIATGTPNEDPTELLVLLYMKDKNFIDAESAAKAYLAKNPKGTRIWIVLSRLYAEEGKTNEAGKTIDKAIALDSKNSDLYMLKAAIFGKKNDYERTMRAIEEGLKAVPENKLLLFSKAYAHETMLKDRKLAIKELDELIAKYPDFYKAQEERAAIEFDLQHYDAAKKLYGEMIDKIAAKELAQGNKTLDNVTAKQDLLEGVQAAVEMIPLTALRSKCLNAKAYCELELGEFDDATRDNYEACMGSPRNAKYRVLQSNICLASGRAGEAQAYMQDALEMGPDEATSYFSQGYNFIAKEQLSEARKAFIDALAHTKETEFPAAYCFLYKAQLERILDMNKEADETLQKAITTIKLNEWPAPIIQYLMGKRSAEAMNKDASDKGKQTEMHFALALEDLANKNEQKSQEELQWVQTNGDPSFMETWAARVMLKLKK